MRVLHLYKTYYPDTVGGVERVINQIARSTVGMGIESEVLSLSPKPIARTIEIDGHLAHRARMDFQIASTGFSLSAFAQFATLAKQFDLIHYHYPWPFMDLLHFAARIKKPTLVTYHSDIIRQKTLLKLYRPLKNRFLSSVDQIVATSPNYLATSQDLNYHREKTIVIPIGLDKSTYPVPSHEVMEKWRARIPTRFFLFVGVLRYYKGLHILIDAVKNKDYPLVIVGSGPVEAELKAHAARLGLKNVHFLGALPEEDKVALLKCCYAVTFPSHLRSEAFGISLLEGAMYGKPLISSEIGTGTSYINVHNQTGLVVPASNPNALGEAMTLLWENPSRAEEMGQQAEQRYWELFTSDHMAESYVNTYQTLHQHLHKIP